MKKIVLTGGGTAGHVTPNIALIPRLQSEGYEILYIGSYQGIEKELIANEGIPYQGISSGKLRRYFALENFTDPFRVLKGISQARSILKKYQPDAVFSKGGFVSVPVVLAASSLKIPIIIHESDFSPGLANKISLKFADKICCNFPETLSYLPKGKAVLTGSPIRKELFSGDIGEARKYTGFKNQKPVILVIGGSLGSIRINMAVRSLLPELLPEFNIVHICGKGNTDETLSDTQGYKQYEYVSKRLKDLFALADLIISRAGANVLCELLALKKPHILIPLSASASRGDQILNAGSYQKQGFSYVIDEEELADNTLLFAIHSVYKDRASYISSMEKFAGGDAVEKIVNIIKSLSR